ncbi:MAG: 4-hydroxy-tetrahydrodipicolinate reductase [Candidatus Kapabacteria bacterium]|nr:4-hydroxy-tetrahydrodipicolinate reductase [Candidatus Kapabacteria bacterium]
MQNNFKIALIGYGKMGKEIHKIAKSQNIEVTDIFDENRLLTPQKEFNFDVAIDFSIPPAVIDNAKIVSACGKNLVIGTTGWYKNSDLVKAVAEQNNTGIVWGSNFSVGMQVFFKIVHYASQLITVADGYDVFMHEIHHKRKKDSPSGSALTLAAIIMANQPTKTEILADTSYGEIMPEQLHISSSRGGEEPGTHTVYLDSAADTIELTHRARSRTAFASGALTAAKLINGKKGFYSFEELLDDMWKTT